MKKFLTVLLLVFCLSGIYVAAEAREKGPDNRTQVTGLSAYSLNSMTIQRRRRMRRWRRLNRRWHRRARRHNRM
ncbi:MAG TPA: hypothetical protein VGC64_05430 [Pyrinomonadaceae bacterium]